MTAAIVLLAVIVGVLVIAAALISILVIRDVGRLR